MTDKAPTLPAEPEFYVWTRDGMDCPREKPFSQNDAWIKFSDYDALRQSLLAERGRAEKAEKALKHIRSGLSNTPVCCGNPTDGHPGNYWEPPDAPECCREPDMLHDIIDAAIKGAQ